MKEFKKSVITSVSSLGDFFIYLFDILYWTVKPPFRYKLFIDQLYFIGNKSIFIIALTSIFSGMVMAYQTYIGFAIMNTLTLVGPVVALSISKELAPVFAGIIVTGRCGAAMAAQIGSMSVTEQIDALEVMGISSKQYLGVPRVWACMIAVPLLSLIFLLVANIGSWFVGVYLLGIDNAKYFSKLQDFVELAAILEGVIKAGVFGFLIGVIGTYFGFQVKGGAEGVGRGTNSAVVWGMIVILVIDFFLTSILVKILYSGGFSL